MNKLISMGLIVLILGGIVMADLIRDKKPDIDKIPNQAKQLMGDKFDAEGYEVKKCWWEQECYFCNFKIGNMIENKRMITCNWEQDKKIINEKGEWVGDYTMEDLIDFDIVKIVNSRWEHSQRTIKPDDKRMEGLYKKWRN